MSANLITCGEFEQFLEAYVEEELSEEMRLRFEHHTRDCPTCEAFVRAYKMSVALAQRLCEDEDAAPPADVPQELLDAVISSLERPPHADE